MLWHRSCSGRWWVCLALGCYGTADRRVDGAALECEQEGEEWLTYAATRDLRPLI